MAFTTTKTHSGFYQHTENDKYTSENKMPDISGDYPSSGLSVLGERVVLSACSTVAGATYKVQYTEDSPPNGEIGGKGGDPSSSRARITQRWVDLETDDNAGVGSLITRSYRLPGKAKQIRCNWTVDAGSYTASAVSANFFTQAIKPEIGFAYGGIGKDPS